MVLDINTVRNEPEKVRESQRQRYAPVELVDQVLALDTENRKLEHDLNGLNRELKETSVEISNYFKAHGKEDKDGVVAKLKEKVPDIKARIAATTEAGKKKTAELQVALSKIGNLVHESVPVSNDEENNIIYKKVGEFKKGGGENRHHHELLYMIDGYDPERGTKVAGHRGYFLKGIAQRLNLAIITYGVDFLEKKGYTSLQTPFFMNQDVMAKTAQLSQFDEELYKVTGATEDKYLIATSEQPISAYHMDEWIEPKNLPLRYAGVSSCFRKEAGAYGKDTWGIFRVHQFEKVEQFVLTEPEKSWEEHENMLLASEEFFQSLGIPYRVVVIVSGELNNAAAKKYDLEGWFPAFDEFRELVSCSNCTDYQSRSLEVRCGFNKQGQKEKKYVHMLNSTLTATSRTICAILENYQTDKGIVIPEVLRPYMSGKDFMPFVNEPPAMGRRKEQEQKAAADKKAAAAGAKKAAAPPAAAAKEKETEKAAPAAAAKEKETEKETEK
eukprot:TRINITY_DN15221_c0_g1_i1.p1 TRINITY_DN15221_c0_g1~~TRINITY_DN15221_c0_g1_i1.p1  ORF type:complete len:499 (+),score=144.25 TRINITY_DN15221_c0_g1_i1:56-1552(+)